MTSDVVIPKPTSIQKSQILQKETPKIVKSNPKNTKMMLGIGVSALVIIVVITSYSIHYTKLYDQCPNERENFNKFQDEDGCPDVVDFKITGDIDNDGIGDEDDLCPYSPETYNKFQDEDGCPDTIYDNKFTTDSDEDGIIDNLDLCPTQAETFNNYQDTDGCPDKSLYSLDADRDGIPNNLDDCPLEPETYNNYQSYNFV